MTSGRAPKLDIKYIENWSLPNDFYIIFRTGYQIFKPPPTAYSGGRLREPSRDFRKRPWRAFFLFWREFVGTTGDLCVHSVAACGFISACCGRFGEHLLGAFVR